MKGTEEVINSLKEKGIKLAIISGSIDIILEHLLHNYKDLFDDIFISRLYFDIEGNISNVDATEYDMEGKALALKKIAERENLDLSECVFVGDHHNDVEIAKVAGLSIAFDPKSDELKKSSDIVVNSKDLRDILTHIL